MSKSGTIIIVDDNKGVLTALQILLKNYFSKVVALSSPVTLSSVIREEAPGSNSAGYEFHIRHQHRQ